MRSSIISTLMHMTRIWIFLVFEKIIYAFEVLIADLYSRTDYKLGIFMCFLWIVIINRQIIFKNVKTDITAYNILPTPMKYTSHPFCNLHYKQDRKFSNHFRVVRLQLFPSSGRITYIILGGVVRFERVQSGIIYTPTPPHGNSLLQQQLHHCE